MSGTKQEDGSRTARRFAMSPSWAMEGCSIIMEMSIIKLESLPLRPIWANWISRKDLVPLTFVQWPLGKKKRRVSLISVMIIAMRPSANLLFLASCLLMPLWPSVVSTGFYRGPSTRTYRVRSWLYSRDFSGFLFYVHHHFDEKARQALFVCLKKYHPQR